MPTYEYECQSCQHVFEAFQSMKDAPLDTCPQCGGKVKRLVGTGAGILFRGSGFYCTDFKNSGSSASKTTETKSAESKPPCADKGGCSSCAG